MSCAKTKEVLEDSDLVCTHPMFGRGSGKDGWKDLKFMYERVRVRDEDLCSSYLQIFEHEVLFYYNRGHAHNLIMTHE